MGSLNDIRHLIKYMHDPLFLLTKLVRALGYMRFNHFWVIFIILYVYMYVYAYTYAYMYTVKPVCNDHLFNKINYLWFIQKCVLMKTEGTNLLVLTMSAFWSSS